MEPDVATNGASPGTTRTPRSRPAADTADDGDDPPGAVVLTLHRERLTPTADGRSDAHPDGGGEPDAQLGQPARALSRPGRTVPGVNSMSTIDGDTATPADADELGSMKEQPARAQSRRARTVPGVNHNTAHRNSGTALDSKFRTDAQHRAYKGIGGSLGDLLHNPSQVAARHQLTLVDAAAAATPGQFPCGVEARVLDADGRLRPQFAVGQVSDLLGWGSGVLTTTLINGWLVLTQRPEQVGAPRGRSSDKAGFTIGGSGTERICLRPAHLVHLDIEAGSLLLLAVIPDQGAVVIVNPLLIAAQAPGHVRPLLGAEPTRHLAVVADDVDVFIKEAR